MILYGKYQNYLLEDFSMISLLYQDLMFSKDLAIIEIFMIYDDIQL